MAMTAATARNTTGNVTHVNRPLAWSIPGMTSLCTAQTGGNGAQIPNASSTEDAYARLAASSWSAIRGTAVPIGSRMMAVAAVS